MTTKLINIKDDKALEVLRSLENIDFIEFVDKLQRNNLVSLKPRNTTKTDSFLDLKGVWKNRDISLAKIRGKAWPQR